MKKESLVIANQRVAVNIVNLSCTNSSSGRRSKFTERGLYFRLRFNLNLRIIKRLSILITFIKSKQGIGSEAVD